MTIMVAAARQVHRSDAGDGEVVSVQVDIVARIGGSLTTGYGSSDASTLQQADAEAWQAVVDNFCDAAWMVDTEVEFEVIGQCAEPTSKAAELNREWRWRRDREPRHER